MGQPVQDVLAEGLAEATLPSVARPRTWRPASSRAAGQPRVLLIGPQGGLPASIQELLEDLGCDVQIVPDAGSAMSSASAGAFDVLVVDGQLSDGAGFDFCRDVRARGDETPILLFTARNRVSERIQGLRSGADDCVDDSFERTELVARVEALLRRRSAGAGRSSVTYRFGEISLDLRKSELKRHGVAVSLSPKEYQLLRYLLEHRGVTLSREELLNEVWGYDAMPSTRTVDVHVAWLRRKLEVNPRCPQLIITVHGTGYKFVA
jgi:two-component system, OmpR family, alkaline phosphatase synthesis response regulator PhoP